MPMKDFADSAERAAAALPSLVNQAGQLADEIERGAAAAESSISSGGGSRGGGGGRPPTTQERLAERRARINSNFNVGQLAGRNRSRTQARLADRAARINSAFNVGQLGGRGLRSRASGGSAPAGRANISGDAAVILDELERLRLALFSGDGGARLARLGRL